MKAFSHYLWLWGFNTRPYSFLRDWELIYYCSFYARVGWRCLSLLLEQLSGPVLFLNPIHFMSFKLYVCNVWLMLYSHCCVLSLCLESLQSYIKELYNTRLLMDGPLAPSCLIIYVTDVETRGTFLSGFCCTIRFVFHRLGNVYLSP